MTSRSEARAECAGESRAAARVCLLREARRDLRWACFSITGRSIRLIGLPAGSSQWLVALAEGAGIGGSDVVGGTCTLQVLQGQVRVRRPRQRDLTVFPGDLLELPDALVWLDGITNAALIVTGAPREP